MAQKIALLGSTGSIGEQTLDIVRNYPGKFEVYTLSANRNWQRLAEQAAEFMPDSVVIGDREFYEPLTSALSNLPVKVYSGPEALCQVVANEHIDVVVNALVGYAGMEPTLCTLQAGKKLALANKESLVVAGDLALKYSLVNKAPILPVDSEHSAIFQCLTGEATTPDKIILTASGGPFRDMEASELGGVSIEQALAHPNWEMGAKITIDSATMMNKGFEVIEARWLFGLDASRIEVLIHPESVVHSLVEFPDGAVKAQLGTPDMHLPIQYALTYPSRWPSTYPKLSLKDYGQLTFYEADPVKYRCLQLAYDCLAQGGNCCCALNAANEVAVQAFLEGRIPFTGIAETIEETMARTEIIKTPDIEAYRATNAAARLTAENYITGQ